MIEYSGKDMARSFRTVRNNTLTIAEEIPENKYDFRASADTRSVGQLLTHIAVGPWIQTHIQSNKIDDITKAPFGELVPKLMAEEAKSRSKAEVIAFLKSEGDKFAAFLEGLSNEFLAERVKMPPGADPATKTRFEMLLGPKEHEMHHRGQLMLLQRMLGITPHLTRQMQERMAQSQR
jgi:uncharacterized damage-inducible protein DinB